jgi:hypothetical protein
MALITGTLDATESNEDVLVAGASVGAAVSATSQEGASVTITEIPAQSGGTISIGES